MMETVVLYEGRATWWWWWCWSLATSAICDDPPVHVVLRQVVDTWSLTITPPRHIYCILSDSQTVTPKNNTQMTLCIPLNSHSGRYHKVTCLTVSENTQRKSGGYHRRPHVGLHGHSAAGHQHRAHFRWCMDGSIDREEQWRALRPTPIKRSSK